MQFQIGETLVYPHHGAVTVTALQSRHENGVEIHYMTLEVHASELTIQLPVANFELVGVRSIIDVQGVADVFQVLRDEYVEEAGNWSRRFKANQEKMASGNVFRVSEVVRDLWHRDQEKGVSAGEKRLLEKALRVLVSELALAQNLTESEASDALINALKSSAIG
ncbi:MAG: CarD family transcriptional regulator [Mycetocola sp.]